MNYSAEPRDEADQMSSVAGITCMDLSRTPVDGPSGDALCAALSSRLDKEGALLVRGISGLEPTGFQLLTDMISSRRSARYRDMQSVKRKLAERVFTSTEHPASESISLHCENAHRIDFPGRIVFGCQTAATSGGATTFAFNSEIESKIPSEILETFKTRGVRYKRTFGFGFGFTWQEVLETEDRDAAEAYMKANRMGWDWEGPEKLRIWFDRPAFAAHPLTGKQIWCNNATHYHPRSLAPRTYRAYKLVLSEDEMPYSVCFGDGSPITDEVFNIISDANKSSSRRFDWIEGDILLLDNVLCAHGREPFAGDRRIIVSMSFPVLRENPDATAGVATLRYQYPI